MPGPPPEAQIGLSATEREALKELLRKAKAPQRDAQRARIVLLAADGFSNSAIAQRLDCSRETVRLWRSRFAEQRFEGLDDKPRSGRPPHFSPSAHRRRQGSGV